MPRMSRLLLAALAVLALVLGACGDDDDDDAGEQGSSTTSTTSGSGTGTTEEEDATTTTTAASGAAAGGTATAPTSGGPTTTATPAGGESTGVIEVSIVGGNVEGGVRRERVKQGAQVTLRVTSDVADELHVHTYDLRLDLVPGQSADLTFLARIPGVFEVELEERGKQVLELEVAA